MKPFTLTNAYFFGTKAGVSTLLALLVSDWLGNPDLVSAAFVAVLTCSPAVSMGLRQARAQLFGSVLGGGLGTLVTLVGMAPITGIPVSVALSVWGALALGFPRGVAVASFTALFVQLVQFGGPLETFSVRILAVVIAGLSGLMVNIIISAFFYDRVFGKRVVKLIGHLEEQISCGVLDQGRGFLASAPLVGELGRELESAANELAWRRDQRTLSSIRDYQRLRVGWDLLIHHVRSYELESQRLGVADEEMCRLMRWLSAPAAQIPTVPRQLRASFQRVVDARNVTI